MLGCHRRKLSIVVVLTKEYDGEMPQTGKIDRLMKGAGGLGAISEEGNDDTTAPTETLREPCSDRDG
jgi:hypothetical protein